MTAYPPLPRGARRIDVKRPDGAPLPASPHRMTFSEALQAAAYIVRGEHAPGPPCKVCKETLALLSKAEKALDYMAVGNNLVWPALRASVAASRPKPRRHKRRRV
jgi:hypothetical protein